MEVADCTWGRRWVAVVDMVADMVVHIAVDTVDCYEEAERGMEEDVIDNQSGCREHYQDLYCYCCNSLMLDLDVPWLKVTSRVASQSPEDCCQDCDSSSRRE